MRNRDLFILSQHGYTYHLVQYRETEDGTFNTMWPESLQKTACMEIPSTGLDITLWNSWIKKLQLCFLYFIILLKIVPFEMTMLYVYSLIKINFSTQSWTECIVLHLA